MTEHEKDIRFIKMMTNNPMSKRLLWFFGICTLITIILASIGAFLGSPVAILVVAFAVPTAMFQMHRYVIIDPLCRELTRLHIELESLKAKPNEE